MNDTRTLEDADVHIGLLEDDNSQIELISLWADETGYKLKPYTTGASFREAVGTEDFDLLVLDWNLPDTNGLDELDWLRKEKNSTTPVIFITSRDDESNVVEALDHGADDYMVKPVSKHITLSRIKALLRRNGIARQGSASDSLTTLVKTGVETFPPYLIDHDQCTLSIDGEDIKLTNKEFELAVYLFQHAGALVARDTIMEQIWEQRADLNTRTVDTHISRIRTKLGISPSTGWQLSSIYQRGYRLSRVATD